MRRVSNRLHRVGQRAARSVSDCATGRQIAGMLISPAGILVILSRGEPDSLLQLQFHAGDGWILLAMPAFGIYSVLLKRRPPELGGVVFLFLISVAEVMLLAPAFALETLHAPLRWPTAGETAAVLYVAAARAKRYTTEIAGSNVSTRVDRSGDLRAPKSVHNMLRRHLEQPNAAALI